MPFTAVQKRREIVRELKLRQRVYPRWIEAGKLSEAEARRQIDIMTEIARDYEELEQMERLL